MSLEKKDLPTLPEHMSYPRFLMGSCCLMINFKCSVLKFFVCSFGHWSVLLWFSTSDYPFVSSNVSYQFMIFAYYFLWCCWFESRSGRGVQHYLIKFVNDLRQVSPGTPVSSINKADRHDITEILLKVALNTIKPFTISI